MNEKVYNTDKRQNEELRGKISKYILQNHKQSARRHGGYWCAKVIDVDGRYVLRMRWHYVEQPVA